MKVLMYPNRNAQGLLQIGGVQKSVRNLMLGLHARGIDCELAVLGYPVPREGWLSSFRVHYITPHSDPLWYRPRSWASVMRSTVQLWLAIKASRPQILHVQAPFGQCVTTWLVSMVPRTWKIVITVHGEVFLYYQYGKGWFSRCIAKADAVVAVSHEVACQIGRSFPNAIGACTIYNGLEESWFSSSAKPGHESPPFVLYCGRFTQEKGVDILLQAWSAFARHQGSCGVHLWLVGDGPERHSLEKMACELGVQDSVRFLGAVQDMEQLKRLYRGALALVLPSRSEGLGNVLLEAGACGTVCIGSSVGGIPEVIADGETGFLFPPGDVDALARTIAHVLEMPETERRQMGERARQRIREHFSLERVVEQYIELYQRIAVSL